MSSNQNVNKADLFLHRLSGQGNCSHSEISRKGYDLLAYAMKSLFFDSFDNEKWEIAKGEHGKPFFLQHPEIQFNISHSGNWIVLVIASVPVGIDIQVHKGRRSKHLVQRIFSEKEQSDYQNSTDPETYFFQRWALKESFVKMTGEGITRSLKDLPDRGWSMVLAVDSKVSCAVCAEEMLRIEKHYSG